MTPLANKLRKLRYTKGIAAGMVNRSGEPRGYTQTEIAEVVGLVQPNYAEWETGKNRPTVWRLQRLAKFYRGTIAELFPEFKLSLEEKEHLAAGREILSKR